MSEMASTTSRPESRVYPFFQRLSLSCRHNLLRLPHAAHSHVTAFRGDLSRTCQLPYNFS